MGIRCDRIDNRHFNASSSDFLHNDIARATSSRSCLQPGVRLMQTEGCRRPGAANDNAGGKRHAPEKGGILVPRQAGPCFLVL